MTDHGKNFQAVRMEYECHITLRDDFEMHATWRELAADYGWKTSVIDGDPILGQEKFFYFTKHQGTYQDLKNLMDAMVALLGDYVVRTKIEAIIWDTKTRHTKEPVPRLGMTQGKQGSPDFVEMPKVFNFHNASNERCDMLVGQCSCGATHHSSEWMLVRL